MLVALYRIFGVKTIMKKLTHKEFPFLISCWKNSGWHCSGGSQRRVEPAQWSGWEKQVWTCACRCHCRSVGPISESRFIILFCDSFNATVRLCGDWLANPSILIVFTLSICKSRHKSYWVLIHNHKQHDQSFSDTGEVCRKLDDYGVSSSKD